MPKRIAIDTGVARELCYSEPSWFSAFVDMRLDGWSFHLTDICVGELIAARERNSIYENQWAVAVARLDQILGECFPCLPGKRDLFHLCGFLGEDDPNKERLTDEFYLKYSQCAWRTIRQSSDSQTAGAEETFIVGEKRYSCPVKPGIADLALEQERQKWISEMSRAPNPEFDYCASVERVKADFDSWAKTDGLPMSVRGDILAHAHAEFERRLGAGYKASSLNRKNDGIDILLPFVLLWPAFLLTTDKWLHGFLRTLPSFQSEWTFRPEELAESWRMGNLQGPDWPE